jgi:hypothetical protein
MSDRKPPATMTFTLRKRRDSTRKRIALEPLDEYVRGSDYRSGQSRSGSRLTERVIAQLTAQSGWRRQTCHAKLLIPLIAASPERAQRVDGERCPSG